MHSYMHGYIHSYKHTAALPGDTYVCIQKHTQRKTVKEKSDFAQSSERLFFTSIDRIPS